MAKMKDGRTHLAHKAEHTVDPTPRRWWPSRCVVRIQETPSR